MHFDTDRTGGHFKPSTNYFQQQKRSAFESCRQFLRSREKLYAEGFIRRNLHNEPHIISIAAQCDRIDKRTFIVQCSHRWSAISENPESRHSTLNFVSIYNL